MSDKASRLSQKVECYNPTQAEKFSAVIRLIRGELTGRRQAKVSAEKPLTSWAIKSKNTHRVQEKGSSKAHWEHATAWEEIRGTHGPIYTRGG